MRNIVWFKDIGLEDVPLVGGKNASLGEMIRDLEKEKIAVPNGFAITSEAYFDFLEKGGIKKKIEEIVSKINTRNIKDLNKKSSQIRSLILNTPFSKDLEEKILYFYKKLSKEYGKDNIDVAVRSSATAEDLPSIAENEMVLVKVGQETRYIEIGKLFKELRESQNNKPIFVPSLVNNKKMKWIKIQEIYQHPAKNTTLYKITTKSGREITITPNHSLLVLDLDKLEAKISSINKLSRDTRVPVIKHLPLIQNGPKVIDVKKFIKSKPTIVEHGRVKIKQKNTLKEQYGLPLKILINKDFAYFLGIYLADGSIYKEKCIDIFCDSMLITNRIREFYKSIDSYKYKKITDKRRIRISNVTFATFLCDIAGKPLSFKEKDRLAKTKYVPDFIFSQPKEIIGEFLRGLFDGGGRVSKKEIGYTSLSKKLIGGTVKLLEMLRINYYLVKNGIEVIIPAKEAKKFKDLINFTEKSKQKKLEELLQNYSKLEKHKLEKHYDFIDIISKSKKISEFLEKKLKTKLKLEKIKIVVCPKCGGKMTKVGFYQDYKNSEIKIKRYKCKNCSFYPSERTIDKLKKKTVLRYIYYDKFGRFKKGAVSWNKGNRKKYGYGSFYFKKIAEKIKLKELLKILNTDIIWDKIKKIEPIKDYSGNVYDFVVPKTQNFAAGIGGIITHNTASFAGMHETFLNVRGKKELLFAIKKCFSSLFLARAISYREEKGFDHMKIAVSVGVQKMVRSDLASSGVIFTLDTESGFPDVSVINGTFGLGEMIVKGRITPDEFFVAERMLLKGYPAIIKKTLGSKKFKMIRGKGKSMTKIVPTTPKEQNTFVLSDDEVLRLAYWAIKIEQHYSKKAGTWQPMDIEWAKDGKSGKLFIVQARPETIHRGEEKKSFVEYRLKSKSKILTKGVAIGQKIGQGRANVIKNVKSIGKFKEGEVLVTKMTDPDWEPIMKMASAIVTDEGGRTCHSAIISRELGVPCIVGTRDATKKIKSGKFITVDCSKGEEGFVYKGRLSFSIKEYKFKDIPKTKTKICLNIGTPESAFAASFLPVDGVGLAREEFIFTSEIKVHPLALLNFDKLDKKTKKEIEKITLGYKDKKEFFVEKLAQGIGRIATAFYPKEVIVRFSDFKSNEYAQLIGGKYFEPEESNPMIGWRGASRYYSKEFKEAFSLECKAIKKDREEYGLFNISVMVPFCRTIEEGKKVVEIMQRNGLSRKKGNFKIYAMCEIPSNVVLIEKFLDIFDGISIGSNDLTQLTLGIDRDSAILANISDERNEAVKKLIEKAIKECERRQKYSGICGDAPSTFPGFAKFLVDTGIESISVNPDVAIKTRILIAEKERKKELKS